VRSPFRASAAACLAAVLAGAALVAATPPVTRHDFICRGRSSDSVDFEGRHYADCSGGHLPRGGVRPALLHLLNELQTVSGRRVVVTSGYRCEKHNRYSWAFTARETGDRMGVSRDSLHRAGAAADFYLEGERRPGKYQYFARKLYHLAAADGEGVWARVYAADKVRDPDNRHDYPYIHVHLLGIEREAAPPEKARGSGEEARD
jgi:hypothetical protein